MQKHQDKIKLYMHQRSHKPIGQRPAFHNHKLGKYYNQEGAR